uniref:UbiA prenyltransferase family protein n=1 Tax=viral metagenome TaxID=1070528 RepID=A0A6C0H1P9_9ZZZZ
MKITSLIIVFFIGTASCFLPSCTAIISRKTQTTHLMKNDAGIESIDIYRKKSQSMFQLIRPENILPTAVINVVGGWIINPSLSLFSTPQFYASILITQLVMVNSMILNDLFDYKTDKINNPDRPLVSGAITKREAISSAIAIFLLSEIVNAFFIVKQLRIITHFANAISLLYTPLLKRIFFVKNISCATMISLGMFFSGITAYTPFMVIERGRVNLWMIATRFMFMGSLYVELLLDITDISGDKKSNIHTIPIVFGKKWSWHIASALLHGNLIFSTLDIMRMSDFRTGMYFILICIPLMKDLLYIREFAYSNKVIRRVVKNTTIPMIIALLYLCLISVYRMTDYTGM